MSTHRSDSPDEVTRLLQEWRDGSSTAGDRLMPLVYDELHRIAEARMRREEPGHTLQATALVNEAYLRLVGAGVDWVDRAHFFAVAARTMRRVLTDHARARQGAKRGGGDLSPVTLDGLSNEDGGPDQLDLVALSAAIDELAQHDQRKASAVELHHYAGLSYEEIARVLDASPATIHRDLRMARALLRTRLA